MKFLRDAGDDSGVAGAYAESGSPDIHGFVGGPQRQQAKAQLEECIRVLWGEACAAEKPG